ncbi:hypothetical protein B0T26DRAFT_232859 [Lasiosphaeria miniovina]|uniref:Uncharacterized protein n=1 Tax=Lasiosphaeria miniovina TaxID=1954250 RepID=A0AA40AVK9_9PEZI|nr:uncharacterized protein B0T26DRAFT_232859 [Lasiosphaeria miniovina]KAK0722776.1 hypothetical protein B0T26DRAFT_232859 [Lasiosphaeria miniovina]
MHFTQVLIALAALTSLATAAPASAEQGSSPARRPSRQPARVQARAPLILTQANITVVVQNQNQNQAAINQLARIAELELAALVQSQIALATQLETIKNNIRLNSIKSQFNQVNSVIVTVTNVVDARDPAQVNRRYILNRLRVDNGFAGKEIVIMVTQKQEMTISTTATTAAANIATTAPVVARDNNNLAALLAGAGVRAGGAPNLVASFNPNTALFALLNQSLLLPYGTPAPALNSNAALAVDDPANIIFAGQSDLFVESAATFQSDCLRAGVNVVSSGGGLAAALARLQLFSSPRPPSPPSSPPSSSAPPSPPSPLPCSPLTPPSRPPCWPPVVLCRMPRLRLPRWSLRRSRQRRRQRRSPRRRKPDLFACYVLFCYKMTRPHYAQRFLGFFYSTFWFCSWGFRIR